MSYFHFFVAMVVLSSMPEMIFASPNSDLQNAIERDLGLTGKEYDSYALVESRAIYGTSYVRDRLKSEYGGSYIERNFDGSFSWVVARTSEGDSKSLPADRIVVVKNSYASLEGAYERLAKRLFEFPKVKSIWIDLKSNRVVIVHTVDGFRDSEALIRSSGIDPELVTQDISESTPQLAQIQWQPAGGDRFDFGASYYFMNRPFCSIGFDVNDNIAMGFLTAGHCGDATSAVFKPYQNSQVGAVVNKNFPGSDYAWVHISDPAVTIRPSVSRFGQTDLGIIGNIELPVGAVICKSGAASQFSCGVLVSNTVSVAYNEGVVSGLKMSTACIKKGDSGGPFFSITGEAQGLASGGGFSQNSDSNCDTQNPVSYFTSVQSALDGIAASQAGPSRSLTIQTVPTCGRLNAGYSFLRNQGIASCNGQFLLMLGQTGLLTVFQSYGSGWYPQRYIPVSADVLAMMPDGNLVMFDSSWAVLWQSGAHGRGATLMLNEHGDVGTLTPQGVFSYLWCSGLTSTSSWPQCTPSSPDQP